MIRLENVNVTIQSRKILKHISLSIKKGEIVSIIGPSGAGKSTLLRCINLLVHPESGFYEIENKNKYDLSRIAKKDIKEIRTLSSMVFQQYGLFENKTVLENITLPVMYAKKTDKNKAVEIAESLLNQMELIDKKNEYPQRLSGGQQQRVGIARALAMEPEILLLDEPTSALDPELVNEVLRIIKRLSDMHDYTMLIVTHEMDFAKRISDRIIFMDDGEIVEIGSPKEIFNTPKEKRVIQFLQKINENWEE